MLQSSTAPRISRQNLTDRAQQQIDRDYANARGYLRQDFNYRCAYCMMHEKQMGGPRAFQTDHFMPHSKGGPKTDYHNLYWSCSICNNIKRDKWPTGLTWEDAQTVHLLFDRERFIDPCREQDYGNYFVENAQGDMVACVPFSGWHIDHLDLNRPDLKEYRQQRNELKHLIETVAAKIAFAEQVPATAQVQEALKEIRKRLARLQKDMEFSLPLIPCMRKVAQIPRLTTCRNVCP